MASLLELKDAFAASGTTNVFDQGYFEVESLTIEVSLISSESEELYIVSPTPNGTYPVLLFCHGYCITNTWYSQLLQHIASHGYIVVAPKFYGWIQQISVEEEIKKAAMVTDWLPNGLPQVLEKAKPDLSKLALCGHSRGGKVAFSLAVGYAKTNLKFKTLLGIDPVDGQSPSCRGKPELLTYVPRAFNLKLPTGIIGTGLGGLSKGIIPPFSPNGTNHAEFFNECKHPSCYFLAKEYGHCDMLDESIADQASWICQSGKGSKEDMRRATGGIVVALLNAYLGDKFGDLNAIVEAPTIAPILLDPVVYVKECDESLV